MHLLKKTLLVSSGVVFKAIQSFTVAWQRASESAMQGN